MSIKIKKKAKDKRSKWQSRPQYWVAVGTLATYTAIGATSKGAVASAQQLDPAAGGSQPGATLPVRRFEIPAGPLDGAVAAFENQTGWRVEISKDGIGSLPSPGVIGIYTPEKALRQLLAGTGVTYRLKDRETAVLDLAEVKAAVDVTANVSDLAQSMPKYGEPILDTPQTINVVQQEIIQEQGATTLRDAVRNVAGISLAAGEGGAQGDSLTIRGFTARNDLFIDGMRDFGSYYRDPFNTEEVEVLQGPSSVTFGRGSTGGVVNQATKLPTTTHFISGDVDFGTDLTRRIALDYDQPFQIWGSQAAFRLNLMGNDGEVADRDVTKNRRYGVAPSLAFGLGTDTRLTVSYFHQQADDIPDYGLPWMFNGAAPVDRENYYGFKHGNFLKTDDDIGTVKAEHDLNSRVTIRSQVRYASYLRDAVITEPKIPTTVTPATPLDQIQITRNEITVRSAETFLQDQTMLTARFKTGWIEHSVAAGVEGGRETSDPIRFAYTGVPTTSLLNPNPDQGFSGVQAVSSNVHTSALSVAAYALDTMHLGRKWDLTGGIRWDRFDTSYNQAVAPASSFERVDAMPSWRAALVFKPVERGSIYFAAGTSFNPSAETLSLSAANANLPPEKNKTYEFGSKWDLKSNRLWLHAAAFRTDKTNAREPDPNNPLLNVLAGNQRVNGIEVEAQGHLTNRWEIHSGYAYLDGSVVSSNYYPAAVGAQLANVPRDTFNFWNDFRLPRHWEAGIGTNFVSSRTASSTVPLDPVTGLVKELPGYWLFNAMVKHPISEHVDLQGNVYNLANRFYYDQIHPAHIIPGAGRSALIGIKFRF